MKDKQKKYILTEYNEKDEVMFLDDFKSLQEIKNYIEKRENKIISIDTLKHRNNRTNNFGELIFNKYYITLDK